MPFTLDCGNGNADSDDNATGNGDGSAIHPVTCAA